MRRAKPQRGGRDFLSDIYRTNMLYGTTVRSPLPSATVARIVRTSIDERITIITSREIPGENLLHIGERHLPILADREARYAGEPVVLLAGANQRELVDASRSLEIEYHELMPSFAFEEGGESASSVTAVRGDPETALADGDQVEGVYRTGIREHLYNEPLGAVVWKEEGRIVVRTATQWPFHVRRTVASALRVSEESVVVRPTDSGITLDGKLWYPSLVATHAALLASSTGRPVKIVYSNTEDFCYTSKRAPFLVRIASSGDEDGALAALRVDARYNAGAYPLFDDEIARRIAELVVAQYECPHVSVSVNAIRTNLPPMNVLAGFGEDSVLFAIETHVDRISALTETNPVDWRDRHIVHPGRRRPRVTAQSERLRRVLEHVTKRSDFRRKYGSYSLQQSRREPEDVRRPARGIGLSLGTRGSGFTVPGESALGSAVIVRLEQDGAIVRTSFVPDPYIENLWVERVSQTLGLERSAVKIAFGETSAAPDSGPHTLSRDLVIVTQLIEQGCATIQKRRFRSPLPIEVRKAYRVPRGDRFDHATLEGAPLQASAVGAAVVEVDVDQVTFESSVSSVWIAVDGGSVIDAGEARRAIEMGIYQSLEWAMHENVTYEAGVVDPRTYLSYRSVSDTSFPRIAVDVLESEGRGSLGIAHIPQSVVPAALAAAVSQATGRSMDQIPTNPVLIHDYLEIE